MTELLISVADDFDEIELVVNKLDNSQTNKP